MMFFSARMASHKSFATLFSVTLYLVNHVFSAHWQDILKLFQMSFRSLKSISIFFSLGFFRVLKQAAINESNQLRPCLLSFSGLAQGTFKAAPKTPMTTTGTAKIEIALKQKRKTNAMVQAWSRHGQIGMRWIRKIQVPTSTP